MTDLTRLATLAKYSDTFWWRPFLYRQFRALLSTRQWLSLVVEIKSTLVTVRWRFTVHWRLFLALYIHFVLIRTFPIYRFENIILKAFTQFYQKVFALRNCLLSLPSSYNKHEHLNSIWHQFSMWPSSCSSFTGRLHLLDRPPSSVCSFRVIYSTIALDWWAHLLSGLVLVRKFSGMKFRFHTSLNLNSLGCLEWVWIKSIYSSSAYCLPFWHIQYWSL